jgi:hypothetical protein
MFKIGDKLRIKGSKKLIVMVVKISTANNFPWSERYNYNVIDIDTKKEYFNQFLPSSIWEKVSEQNHQNHPHTNIFK